MTISQTIQRLKLYKKIILGTAQFTMPYGICNNKDHISKSSIKKIFVLANQNKIRFIDTALNYGNNDNILKDYIDNKHQIITKIPKFKRHNKYSKEATRTIINDSLLKLKIKKFHAVLLHEPNQLLSKDGNKIYKNLLNLKKNKLTKNIGISVYSLKKTIKILTKFKFDLVQLPFNILNQKFNNKNFIELVKKKKIKIHARSIFLQGVLINKKIRKKKYFSRWSSLFRKIDIIKKYNKINDLDLNISFCVAQKWIDKIIIGFDNYPQLKSILNSKIKKLNLSTIPTKINKSLNDPREWTKSKLIKQKN